LLTARPNFYLLTGRASPIRPLRRPAGGRIGRPGGPYWRPDDRFAISSLQRPFLAAYAASATAHPLPLVNPIHRNHTAGNAFFAKQGALIFAREESAVTVWSACRRRPMPAPTSCHPAGFPPVVTLLMASREDHHDDEVVHFITDQGAIRRRHDHQIRESEQAPSSAIFYQPSTRLPLYRHQQRRLAR